MFRKYSSIKKSNKFTYHLDTDSVIIDFLGLTNESMGYKLVKTNHVYSNDNDRFGYSMGVATRQNIDDICDGIINIAINAIGNEWGTIKTEKYEYVSVVVKMNNYFYKMVLAPQYNSCTDTHFEFIVITVITLADNGFILTRPRISEAIFESDKQYYFDKSKISDALLIQIETQIQAYLDNPERYIPKENKEGKIYKIFNF